MLDSRSPVLVGLHQLSQRVDDPLEGEEPLEMMIRSAEAAAEDAGSRRLLASIDVVCVTRGRWHYDDPARVVAERIGAPKAQSAIAPYGGNMVQSAVNRFARETHTRRREGHHRCSYLALKPYRQSVKDAQQLSQDA